MIEFELTETALFQNAGRVRSLLEKLMEMGFGVSIDDFGAGYSSCLLYTSPSPRD